MLLTRVITYQCFKLVYFFPTCVSVRRNSNINAQLVSFSFKVKRNMDKSCYLFC
ncbi:hypothetical protein KDRO_E07860 [Kluyveromyces lactis]|nr:hypothetical protein KDRO_E07860 [Kluyveromyces lactis]